VFPDPRLVAAIVDRVTFNAHIIETGTQSYRLATSKTTARRKSSRDPVACRDTDVRRGQVSSRCCAARSRADPYRATFGATSS
jgi:hypothetical protein